MALHSRSVTYCDVTSLQLPFGSELLLRNTHRGCAFKMQAISCCSSTSFFLFLLLLFPPPPPFTSISGCWPFMSLLSSVWKDFTSYSCAKQFPIYSTHSRYRPFIMCRIYQHSNSSSIPVTARSKAWVHSRSLAWITGSNPARVMDICLLVRAVWCQVHISATGRFLDQRMSYRVWYVSVWLKNLKEDA